MKLTKEQLEIIEQFCDDYDIDFRNDYSGRGMIGRTCIGFVTDTTGFELGMELCRYLYDHLNDDASELVGKFIESGIASDSMGMDTIVYFPSISIA